MPPILLGILVVSVLGTIAFLVYAVLGFQRPDADGKRASSDYLLFGALALVVLLVVLVFCFALTGMGLGGAGR